ncbi:hypothetical protein ACFQFC_33420 [Amorphoplanes digitatis]|uniref:Uncharacterized protein n=1 Tax=Actinoplanes digitatis TaxID=1868 RepID=A0A7W7MP67_9ACTN|nr:hypothetical protein [Actinoplanes digitatis]MBB4761059.1 hypothetical protein [Actinoplanes digitatis]BFE69403.1 hypothetical protein GCM10020092_027040 [Actinoplanes digitatis]GID92675.1 hypothetical protein Adi01nite_20870 [Actinoplanes digitatis]
MTAVARLLPRHWDGRRLLRFLTGLALIALAFAAPVLAASPAVEPAEPPVTIITTVDTPAAPELPADTSLTGRVEVESPAAAALSPADQDTATAPAEPVAADQVADGVADGVADAAVPGERICVEARTPAGEADRDAGGERAPPRI